MGYPFYPTSRPRNPFRLLPPTQQTIAKAAKAGVNTRSRPEIDAWVRAGRPPTWENGKLDL